MAYGGTEPLPFQQGICQSQALEPGLTGNFTKDAMDAVLEYLDCKEPFGHEMQIQCLRSWDMDHLLLASIETYQSDISHNIGDIWLPSVDGDFLPAPPSQLLKEGRFGNATYMFGWTEDDLNYFTDPTIKTANDTRQFITSYLPGMPAPLITKLLDAYPVTDFAAQPSANLSAEFYRTARIFRDILMVCEPLLMADHMHKKYNSSSSNSTCTPQNQIFLYDFNQTILAPAIEAESGLTGLGVVHTSEFAYVFANLTHWNANGWPWHPTVQDNTVLQQASRSWSTFAATGRPSSNADGSLTLQGWEGAYEGFNWGEFGVPSLYVIGGPYQSFSPIKYPDGREGYGMFDYVTRQKLVERCGVINGEEFVGYLGF